MAGCGLYSNSSGQGCPVSICEDGNELSGAIKCREYLD